MSRLWVLSVLGLIVILAMACSDEGEDLPKLSEGASATSSTVATPTATSLIKPSATPPAPTMSPITEWSDYTDTASGFTLPVPEGFSATERSIDYPEANGIPAFQGRTISFSTVEKSPISGVLVAPNHGLSIEAWVSTYPGWPSEPSEIMVGGERALRFSINVLGEPAAEIFFNHGDSIYGLFGGVYGDGHSGLPPTITEADLQKIIQGFRFTR